ncbi:MAG TPA: hypothetical protein VHO43_03040 [Ignavibacteriales bacterium]|nr:hypothetical protein [Ignavibacteriales bacterium]
MIDDIMVNCLEAAVSGLVLIAQGEGIPGGNDRTPGKGIHTNSHGAAVSRDMFEILGESIMEIMIHHWK